MKPLLSVGEALAQARLSGVDRLDAQVLLARRLDESRTWLIAHDDVALAAEVQHGFESDCARCAAGVPLAYLTGEREFHGLSLQVTHDVLIPRPDTEVLVDWALELLQREFSHHAAPEIVDLGTGSGAIALAVARACLRARVTAVDVSQAALRVARANASRLGLNIRFQLGDWWSAADDHRFDLALCNPPYVAADDPHMAALVHEPREALTPGPSGLEALQRVVAGARAHLETGAWILLEHGLDQAAEVSAMLRAAGFDQIDTRMDIESRQRCTGGRWRP